MSKKLSKEEFIKRASEIHGGKYDYSLVGYVNSTTKVKIICPEHGEFEQIPKDHLRGSNCPTCVNRNIVTNEEYIEKAKQVHGNRYDYSLVKYVNTKTKIKIKCSKHGVFEQTPNSHLRGGGCPTCAGTSKLTKKEFIQRACDVHEKKYDYSKVVYVNNRTNVKIICPEHGEFKQKPNSHLNGHGCSKCSNMKNGYNKRLILDNFIKRVREIHGDKYDYRKVVYINSKTKVKIICPKHGVFEQTPTHHLNGCGCGECSNTKKLTTKEFIIRAKQVHGNKYNYQKLNYINSSTKVEIICLKHGVFFQLPHSHLSGRGCPYCTNKTIYNLISLDKLKEIVRSKNIRTQQEYSKWYKKNKEWCMNNGIPSCPDVTYKQN